MTKTQTKLSFVQKLVALGICLAFTLSSTSFTVHASGSSGSFVETVDGFVLADGQTYTVSASSPNASSNGNDSMAADHMESTADIIYTASSQTYSNTITTNTPEYIESISYNGKDATVSDDGTNFTITGIESILNDVTIGMNITPTIQLGMNEAYAFLVIDTTTPPTEMTVIPTKRGGGGRSGSSNSGSSGTSGSSNSGDSDTSTNGTSSGSSLAKTGAGNIATGIVVALGLITLGSAFLILKRRLQHRQTN